MVLICRQVVPEQPLFVVHVLVFVFVFPLLLSGKPTLPKKNGIRMILICRQVVPEQALRPQGMRRQRGRWASMILSRSKDPEKYKIQIIQIQITKYTNTHAGGPH